MYVLSDEIYKLLKFDVLKIIDSAVKQSSPYKPQDHLQNECDYFAQSFVNPQDYFFFRFRKMYLKIVLTRKTYHLSYSLLPEHRNCTHLDFFCFP